MRFLCHLAWSVVVVGQAHALNGFFTQPQGGEDAMDVEKPGEEKSEVQQGPTADQAGSKEDAVGRKRNAVDETGDENHEEQEETEQQSKKARREFLFLDLGTL
ncbi:unnamed protein product [Amoebophrya sp. A25]|nr:unnamed protein product [Amoebophrya sp. A25]|eukprot:GSA25T00025134001.1